MLDRMLAKSILALAAMLTASATPSNDSALKAQRFFLSCAGTMHVADAPATPIIAEAFLDLALHRLDGFGVTDVPIVQVTDAEIVFDGAGARYGEHVKGSLDRHTGKARIVVLTVSEPARELIAMELDCRPATSIS
jgi:hypothetical protein